MTTSNPQKALKWLADNNLYSPTGLVQAILSRVGVEGATVPGPDYWVLPSGRSMYEESKLVAEKDS